MKYHKLKTIILNTLDILPSKIGYFLYHQLQKRTFRSIDNAIVANQNSYKIIRAILKKNDIELKNSDVIEIGSGWLPLIPYILKINEEIDFIHTYDINEHYSNKRIAMVNSYYKEFNFELEKTNNLYLPNFIKYHSNQNIINSKLPKDVKLYFSKFVLEHVTPRDIEKIHEKLFNDMDEGSAILHLISPSDHRAYSDASLSYYDFLKYSKIEWDKIQTKFDYHNRLRLPQYVEIFKKIGFEIVFLEYDKVPEKTEKYKMFKELKIHPDYNKYNEEEILAGSINILLKK